MNDAPSAPELLRAVERFLEEEVVPALDGPRRYHARVAANVVAIVAREIETEESQLAGEWRRTGRLLGDATSPPASREALGESLRARNQELCERIRAGELGVGSVDLMAHLRQTVADKLAVAKPPRLGRTSGGEA